jgi:hypothetical protein
MKMTLAAVAFAMLLPLQVFSLSTVTPAQAQAVSQPQEGDYYAPSNTVVQQPTPQQLNEAKDGDYYAPSNTVVQQPTSQELNRARQGDYYAPDRN